MKHLLFILFLLSTTCQIGESQTEFAPVGAEWYYRYVFFWTGTDAFAHATCLQDTLIQGRNCKIVCLSRITQNQQPEICDEILYFYQSGDSIFHFMPEATTQSELIFRNNFKVGELFQTDYAWPYRVSDIDSVYYDGKLVRWFELRDTFNGTNIRYISDVFGPSLGFFDPFMGNVADYHEYYLRCYSDSTFGQISLTNTACNTVHVPTPLVYNLTIIPNPVLDKLYLDFSGRFPSDNIQFNVWDEAGRLVLTENKVAGTKELDVHLLSPGFYVLVIHAGTTTIHQKFIKY